MHPIAAEKKATVLDPLSNAGWSQLGLYLTENRQFADAHEAFRRALEIQPESAEPLRYLGGSIARWSRFVCAGPQEAPARGQPSFGSERQFRGPRPSGPGAG